MKSYFKDEKGFTLIEMLLVLSIFIVISSVVFQFSIKITEKQVIDQFFNQLQIDIQRMQALAMETDQTINFTFLNENKYRAHFAKSEVILERSFPPCVEFNTHSNTRSIGFNSKGEILNFGSISFYTTLGEKVLVLNIYKGRIRYVEL